MSGRVGDGTQVPGNAAPGWREARHVLAIRLDTLGDVLMTTPAIRALKQSGPDGRRITLLTSAAGAAAARLIPEIDDVLVYDAPWLKASAPQAPDSVPAMAAELAARGIDAAVIFTTFSQSPLPAAMLCQVAGIPLRLAHCRENPYQLLTDWVAEPERDVPLRHEVRRQLDLVAAVGASTGDERLSLTVPDDAAATVSRVLHEIGLDPARGWVVVHPGASAPSRRYPPEHFAEVVRLLHEQLHLQVVFTGTEPEASLISEIRDLAAVPAISAAGRFDLPQLAALLQRAPLLVANNTGPVHVSAAVGTPVVDIYALTNTQHTPWAVPARVLSYDVPCRNCLKSVCPMGHHDCLRRVQPAEVVQAVADLLGLPIASALHRRRPWRDLTLGRPALPVLSPLGSRPQDNTPAATRPARPAPRALGSASASRRPRPEGGAESKLPPLLNSRSLRRNRA